MPKRMMGKGLKTRSLKTNPTKKRVSKSNSGSKVIREGISGMSVDASGKVTNAGKKFFKFKTK